MPPKLLLPKPKTPIDLGRRLIVEVVEVELSVAGIQVILFVQGAGVDLVAEEDVVDGAADDVVDGALRLLGPQAAGGGVTAGIERRALGGLLGCCCGRLLSTAGSVVVAGVVSWGYLRLSVCWKFLGECGGVGYGLTAVGEDAGGEDGAKSEVLGEHFGCGLCFWLKECLKD